MAALFLKRLTLQTLKTSNGCIRSWLGKYVVQKRTPAQLRLFAPAPGPPHLTHTHAFSTDGDTQDEKMPKRMNGTDFSNIGRKIHDRIIHVLDEKGNDLGNMHRAAVIRLMDERDLRLVKRCSDAQPPEYQLLTGAQIHAERLQLRSEARAAPQPGGCELTTPRGPFPMSSSLLYFLDHPVATVPFLDLCKMRAQQGEDPQNDGSSFPLHLGFVA